MPDASLDTARPMPGDDMVRTQLERILASPTFAQSERIKRLLRFLVEETLNGNSDRVKEYVIGVDVFDRTPDFDPRTDSTVRVQAGKLRDKLREYYLTEGRDDALRIDLPRGGYIPVFHLVDAAPQPASGGQPIPAASAAPLKHLGWRHLPWLITASIALAAGILAYVHFRQTPSEMRVVRFTIPPPENREFGAVTEISPDGSRVLANLVDSSGEHALWVRPLDSASGYVLPGTEGKSRIVGIWSADGASVISIRDGTINRLDLAGMKPVERVGQSAGFWGISSNRSGVILVGSDGAGIQRLNSDGVGATPVTSLDASRQEVGHYQPRFLPDGKHFLYFARSANPAKSAVYVASLDGKTRQLLVPAASRPVYAASSPAKSSGYLLFVRDGMLFAQQFDLTSLRVSGDPFRVVDHVAERPYGFALFSASQTGVILYRDAGISENSELVWFDRTGKRLSVASPAALYGAFDLSPDDKTLAVDRIDEGRQQDIWTVNLENGEAMRQTFEPDIDHYPIWSPDGKRFVFDSHRGGAADLFTKVVNGSSAEQRLLHLPVGSRVLDWSRDGKFIAYESPGETTRVSDVWILPLDDNQKPFRLIESAHEAKFNADRRWIAYVSSETGRDEVYVRSFRGAPAAIGDAKWQISLQGGSETHWRRDGKELFYLTPDNHLSAIEVKPGTVFATGSRRRLFELDPVYRQSFAVSADGERFLVKVRAQAPRPAAINVFMNWLSAIRP